MAKHKVRTPVQNHIGAFLHCKRCLAEMPEGTSPREWARMEIGWTIKGLQVWCVRHDENVMNLDFGGMQVARDD